MYAVIRSGGKQYRVAPGQTIRVERVTGDVGAHTVEFGDALLVVLRMKVSSRQAPRSLRTQRCHATVLE